jgi:hypothetical protein
MDRIVTTLPPVLSPSSILPPLSSCCTFISARKNKARLSKNVISIVVLNTCVSMNQSEASFAEQIAAVLFWAMKERIVVIPYRTIGKELPLLCVSMKPPNLEVLNPLPPELNPSAQRCVTRYFTGDFAS